MVLNLFQNHFSIRLFQSERSKPLPFVIFGIIALLCALSSVFMTETAKLPLPDKLETRKPREQQSETVELEENSLLSESDITKPDNNSEVFVLYTEIESEPA